MTVSTYSLRMAKPVSKKPLVLLWCLGRHGASVSKPSTPPGLWVLDELRGYGYRSCESQVRAPSEETPLLQQLMETSERPGPKRYRCRHMPALRPMVKRLRVTRLGWRELIKITSCKRYCKGRRGRKMLWKTKILNIAIHGIFIKRNYLFIKRNGMLYVTEPMSLKNQCAQ